MGKYNQFILPFATFYQGQWMEYDEDTEKYADPINVEFKQNQEGVQGVSSGGKRTTMTQNSQGKEVYKKSHCNHLLILLRNPLCGSTALRDYTHIFSWHAQ